MTNASLVADGTGGVIRYDRRACHLHSKGGRRGHPDVGCLRNLVYQRLSLTATGQPGEAFDVSLNIKGSNPDLYDGYPVDLNISLTGRLDDLFRDVRRVIAIPDTIRERIEEGAASGG